MTIAYVKYKLVLVAGQGYPPVYSASEVSFEGGQYTDNVTFLGYLFGTTDQINEAIEKAKPNGMKEISIDEAKAFILTLIPVNTVLEVTPGEIKYSGLPIPDQDGRLAPDLSDTEWGPDTVTAAEAQVEKGNALVDLEMTDYEMARTFEDYYTFKTNGLDFPTAAVEKIEARRAMREKVTGTPVTYPDWTSFRHWLYTTPEGQQVMGRIINSGSMVAAFYNTYLMDQLRQGDYSGVVYFTNALQTVITFSPTEKDNVNAAALAYDLPGPIFV